VPIDSDPDEPDRARESPTAVETPGRREPRDEPEAAGLREQQIAERARYQRVADAAYQAAARQVWAQAVPGLRAGWEEHKEKFPERTRPTARTESDGSWVADGNRSLTPEQNAEANKACADLRDEADQVTLPAMRRVEAASPGGPKDRPSARRNRPGPD
jgi:hypothetical protein